MVLVQPGEISGAEAAAGVEAEAGAQEACAEANTELDAQAAELAAVVDAPAIGVES